MDNNSKKSEQEGNVITVEQFEKLQAEFNSMNEVVKAKDESIKALEENNKKLIDEKRSEETKVETQRQAKMSADGKHDELLAERQKAWESEKSEILGQVSTLSNQLHGMTGESALKASLTSVGVNKDLMLGAEALFRHSWEFDKSGSVMHKGIPLADSIRDWANSDAGKPFLVSNNSGSGSKPSTSTQSSGKKVSEMSFDEKKEAIANGVNINA